MNQSNVEPSVARAARWAVLQRPPLLLGVGWGFFEATLFFIVPDLIITLAALFSVRRAMKQLVAVIGGSIAGGLLMFALAVSSPDGMLRLVGKVPFVRPAMFEKVRSDYAAHGVWALCRGPLSGIPYKVYAVMAPPFVSPVPFALVSVPARLERLLASLAVFVLLGWILRRLSPGRIAPAFAVFIVYWMVVYGFYWTKI
jgi:membrane protein YqaA with SNARE-associated domain